MIRAAFLWHLHQPDYRDPLAPPGPTGTPEPSMPWVRMHALRGYRDMALEAAEQGLPWTLNVVPSLLDQLDHYAGGGTDPHARLSLVPAGSLSAAQRRVIRSTFVAGHPALRRAHPAWAALAERLEGGRSLSVQQWRDVQVWSNLQWFGATARRDFPELVGLWEKGEGFTEADKAVVMDVQRQILEETPTWWRRVHESDGPAVSASAYDHPILPLLVDLKHALRAMPDLPLETDYRWPDDARRQLCEGRERVGEVLGTEPLGLWPSEGSVSPEVLPLVREAGFRWLCTDVHVLQRSELAPGSPTPDEAGPSGPWDLGDGLVGWFRDTELSDHIGFRCAQMPADVAARSFVDLLLSRHREGTVLIALDGENPWETFEDAGIAFRRHLVHVLRERGVELVTLDEASQDPPVGRVERIHSGSWIGADYAVWVGDEEDRRAWQLLADTRSAVHDAGPEAEEAARPHLHAAEGSDWFWWFGDRFSSSFDLHFDALFRAHLVAAHRAAGLEVPAVLSEPVNRPHPPRVVPPSGWVPLPPWGLPERMAAGRVPIPEGSMAAGQRSFLTFGWTRPSVGEAQVVLQLQGDHLELMVDGRAVGGSSHVQPAQPIHVQVLRDGQPVWPEPVHIEPPAPDHWWGP